MSRGYTESDLYPFTFGEIIYMENEAQTRDRILQACAAQDPKLLPKKQGKQLTAGEKLKRSVGAFFQ